MAPQGKHLLSQPDSLILNPENWGRRRDRAPQGSSVTSTFVQWHAHPPLHSHTCHGRFLKLHVESLTLSVDFVWNLLGFRVLEVEPKALCILGICSSIELHPQALLEFFLLCYITYLWGTLYGLTPLRVYDLQQHTPVHHLTNTCSLSWADHPNTITFHFPISYLLR